MASNKDDRLFTQNGRRSYRRTFNATETHIGIFVVLALIGVLVWVFWKGGHPDPTLFAFDTDFSQAGETAPTADRGPIPLDIAAEGWTEGPVSEFDTDNLYVKINGREGYYKSFGFERLYFLSLVAAEDDQTAVDIELYDLGTAANAVGAYAGERSAGATPTTNEMGLTHIERNALYLTRGRYYLRAIGSSEAPEVVSLLEYLQNRFEELPGEPLPWGFALFTVRMGMDAGVIAYTPENAFSFGFARDVYSATLKDGTELFVTPAPSESAAAALANEFENGFRQYGESDGDYVRDRYRHTYAMAATAGPWVIGFHQARDTDAATQALSVLANHVREMPVPESDRSEPTAAENVEEEHESDEY